MGRIGINTTSPGYNLDVIGSINFTGSLLQNGTVYGGGSSQWTTVNTNEIYYNAGNVGIGLTNPNYTLDVGGNINFTGSLYQNGTIYGGGSSQWNLLNNNVYYSSGSVGIGTNSPSGLLHISAGTAGDCRLILEADTDNNNENDNPRIEFWQDGSVQASAIGMTNHRLNLWNSIGDTGAGIAFHTGSTDGYTNATERVTIESTGHVGINQTNPSFTLDVGGNINFTGVLTQNGILYGGGSGGSGQWNTVNTNEIYYNLGNVGIGLTNPNYTLHVDGNIYATGNVTAYSDKRAKTNLRIIGDALDKVSNLNGYTYEKDGAKYTGLVAQEVLEVLPEAVVGNEEDGYGLAYGNMVGILVEAIKELSNEVKILKEKLYS